MHPRGHTMQKERRFDPLYDPLYKTSDGRVANFLELENLSDNRQQRLPSYKNMFSALPERYPSYSLRSQSIEAARQKEERQSHPVRMSCASPTRSVRSLKLRRAATSPQKPSTSPSLGRTTSTATPKRLPRKGRLEKAATDVYPVAIDHAKLRAVFEQALPPLTDSKSLAARKQLLEAWESAEWDSREAQIRTLQEAQIRDFEDSIKAKHAQDENMLRRELTWQAEQSISQRLSARWAVEQGSAVAEAARAAHQGTRKSQHLAKMRRKDEEKLARARSGQFEGMLGAVGHGMMRASKGMDIQADSKGPSSEAETVSRTGSSPIPAYCADTQPALKGSVRPPGRKELAYVGHLDRVHQALLANKEPDQVINGLAATAPPQDDATPDILVVDDGPDTEQAEQPDELFQPAGSDAAPGLNDVHGLTPDSPPEVAAEAPLQGGLEYVLASESPESNPPHDAADWAVEDTSVTAGNKRLASSTWANAADDSTEGAPQAYALSPAVEPTDAIASEVAAMTDELLNMAIYEDQAMTAQQPHGEEEALGAALEATIEGLVSLTEAAQPVQLSAEHRQVDVGEIAVWELGGSKKTGDAEGESVVTISEGIPILSIIQAHVPHTTAGALQEFSEVQGETADTSAAGQQALANSILSGDAAPASPSDAEQAPLLYGLLSADSTAANLDSMIGSQYQPKELSAPQSSGSETHTDAKPGRAAEDVTVGYGDSMEHSPAANAAVNGPDLHLGLQEDAPALDLAEHSTDEQQGDSAETIPPRAHTLAPADETDNAARPCETADTRHDAPSESAPPHEPSHAERPSEAANLDTHDSVQVSLTLVSSVDAHTQPDDAESAQARLSTEAQPEEEHGMEA